MRRRPLGSLAAADRGFTLIEALVALAIGGFVIAVIADITGQWLRNWRHGAPALQRAEQLAAALDRVAADLSMARFVPGGAGADAMFSGDERSVIFVRPSLPVESPSGLEVVSLAPPGRAGEATLTRGRSPLPFGAAGPTPRDPAPVALLRQPYGMRFAYADATGDWRATWREPSRLPRWVRLDVVDRTTGRAVLPPGVVAIHVDAPLSCATARSAAQCDTAMGLAAGQAGRSAGSPL